MKRVTGVFLAGFVVLAFQGALATFLPSSFCPDFGLLYVLAVGLCWEGAAGGLVLVALLGYAADLLSGSMLGQHAVLRLLAFSAAFLTCRQINLRGALPLFSFAAGIALAYALGVGVLTSFFTGEAVLRPGWLGDLIPHVLVTALFAPWVSPAVAWLWAWLGDEGVGRRSLQLDARGPAT